MVYEMRSLHTYTFLVPYFRRHHPHCRIHHYRSRCHQRASRRQDCKLILFLHVDDGDPYFVAYRHLVVMSLLWITGMLLARPLVVMMPSTTR